MAPDVGIGSLQGFDAAQSRLLCVLAQVMLNGIVDILVGQRTRDDRFDLHPRARPWTQSRRPVK